MSYTDLEQDKDPWRRYPSMHNGEVKKTFQKVRSFINKPSVLIKDGIALIASKIKRILGPQDE